MPFGDVDVFVNRWALQATKDNVPMVAMEFQASYDDGTYDRITQRWGVDPDKQVGDNTNQLELAVRALRRVGWEGSDLYELNRIDPPKVGVTIRITKSKKVDEHGNHYTNVDVLGDMDPRAFAMTEADAQYTSDMLRGYIEAIDAKAGGRKAPKRPVPTPRARPAAAPVAQAAPGKGRGRPNFAAPPIDNGPPPTFQQDEDIPY